MNSYTGKIVEMTKLGKKIYDLRRERQFSQDRLAEKLDVSRQTIYNWETGTVVPSADRLKALSEVLDVPLETFFEEEAIAETEPAADQPMSVPAPQPVAEVQAPVAAQTAENVLSPKEQKRLLRRRKLKKALLVSALVLCGLGIVVLPLVLAIIGSEAFSNLGDEQVTSSYFGITPQDSFILVAIALACMIAAFTAYWIVRAVRKKKARKKDETLQNVKDSLQK